MTLTSQAKAFVRPVVRPLRRRIADSGFYRLRHTTILSEPLSPELVVHFSSIMKRPGPLFVGRVGGSDYELVSEYFRAPLKFASEATYAQGVRRLMEFNGYFDFENRYDNFLKFLDDFVAYYKRADCLTYGGANLIRQFGRNGFKKFERNFLDYISAGKDLIDYSFIEYLTPFLESFRDWGQDKTVLIVSPFARSLKLQYERRNQLIKGYQFPDFQLATYNSPVTYSTPADSRATLRVATRNWHEECEVMALSIACIDFDIALLSCASYSMYLGDFIRNSLGKKALYLGGMLNPMFNIYGHRYDYAYLNDLMNLDCQINALENQDFEHSQGGRSLANEAFRAYFGTRPREAFLASEQGDTLH